MSSLTTTTINTMNATTDLTLMTGNSSAAAIVLATNGTMQLKANSTLNAISISATSITTNTATFTSNGNFTASGNVSAVNIAASANVSAVNIAASANVSAVNIAASANVTANIIDVASNSLFVGTSSYSGSNGYTYLTNGFKMNWGVVAAANTASGTTATFTSAFSQAPFVVTVSHQGNGRVPAPSLVTSSAASCNITTGLSGTSGTNVHFIAIGI